MRVFEQIEDLSFSLSLFPSLFVCFKRLEWCGKGRNETVGKFSESDRVFRSVTLLLHLVNILLAWPMTTQPCPLCRHTADMLSSIQTTQWNDRCWETHNTNKVIACSHRHFHVIVFRRERSIQQIGSTTHHNSSTGHRHTWSSLAVMPSAVLCSIIRTTGPEEQTDWDTPDAISLAIVPTGRLSLSSARQLFRVWPAIVFLSLLLVVLLLF